MNKDFDFSQVGKRMPYRTPERFFQELEDDVMGQVATIEPLPKPSPWRKRIAWGTCISAAAAVALLVTVNLKSQQTADDVSEEAVNVAFARLAPEDQAFLLEVWDEDVLIDEETELY
ncbi:MAG: hypothetical protein ACI30R_07715 [Sodaliphilus sp.]